MANTPIVHDNRTEAERRYDALKDGSAYVKAGADTVWAPILDITADPTNDGREDEADRLLIEADNRRAAKARQAPTMRERVDLLLDVGHLPDGNEIFDLVLEDRVVHYAWVRCIDWVLWRLAHGKPVKTLAQPDRDSTVIDARYDAARVLSSDTHNYSAASTEADIHLLCAGELIEKWERTPEQEAEIAEDTDLIIRILTAIDGGE